MDKGYIAGIIDGEGCLTLKLFSAKKRNDRKQNSFQPRIQVKMRCLPILEKLQDKYNGRIYIREAYGNTRKAYQWELTKREDLKNILHDILPFLIEKREQAEVLLEYLGIERRKRIPKIRQEYYDKLQSLKREEW